MSDLISRQAAKEILAKYHLGGSRIAEELNELPSVQRTSNAKKHVENTLKNTLEDAISRQAALDALSTWDKFGCDADTKLVPYKDHYIPYIHYDDVVKCIKGLPSVSAEKTGRWIPMTTRPMDDDEKEHFAEQLEYVDDAEIFNCPLPDDGQEVLITIYGETEIDTFLRDDVDGCYFENRDIEDVRAWMPLPQPYKSESEVQDADCD